jgi:type II secretory pathway pseudopilin PulG
MGKDPLEPSRLPADTCSMRTRLRAEAGMGLVELMIAMTILAVALLALVAAFSSGALTLGRAGQTSTAAALANQQMELYRGIKYAAIQLDSASVTTANSDSVYTNGGAAPWTATQVTGSCPGVPPECNPSRTVPAASSPDKRTYRVDTYIAYETTAPGRELKRVTVLVRDGDDLTHVLVRISSKFDQISG